MARALQFERAFLPYVIYPQHPLARIVQTPLRRARMLYAFQSGVLRRSRARRHVAAVIAHMLTHNSTRYRLTGTHRRNIRRKNENHTRNWCYTFICNAAKVCLNIYSPRYLHTEIYFTTLNRRQTELRMRERNGSKTRNITHNKNFE